MKILVTATTFPRWEKDTEPAFVYFLSRLLAKKGHEIINLVPHHSGAKKYEEKDGMKIYRFRYFFSKYQKLCYDGGILPNMKKSHLAKLQLPFLVMAEYLAIKKILKKEKVDVIHAHWIVPQGYLAALIKRKYNIPYIVSAHAGDVFPLKSRFLRRFGKIALENCDYCTVNSRATGESVKKVSNIKNISVIPMGVDLSNFSPKRKSEKIIKKFDIQKEFLLFVGRLAEKKGLKYLLLAMPAVIKKFPQAKLMIIGSGPSKSELEDLAKKLKITNNIIFTGKIRNDMLSKYYASADLFVGPSIITKSGDTEGLGIVFLEALASGTTVIGSNVGGIPDIIKDGKTGLLVEQKNWKELASKIIMLLENKKLRGSLIKEGQKHIKKNYEWSILAEKFDKILEKISSRKDY